MAPAAAARAPDSGGPWLAARALTELPLGSLYLGPPRGQRKASTGTPARRGTATTGPGRPLRRRVGGGPRCPTGLQRGAAPAFLCPTAAAPTGWPGSYTHAPQ